ncbi:MAG: efflux RND transporter periplasmic adaptor subunit [Patescibacteria group bacterium]
MKSIKNLAGAYGTKLLGFRVHSKQWAMKHKFISVVLLVVALGGAWWAYGLATTASAETRYVLSVVGRGTVISSVSASGQVSSSNQLDIQAKVSGEILSVNVTPGQKVYAGQMIAIIDPTSAEKAVRDAEANLESAQISLEKLQKPASALTVTQAQNALTNAEDALVKLYSDSNTDVVNAFLDLPGIITNLEDILTGTDACGGGQWNVDCYTNAMSGYDSEVEAYSRTAQNDYTAAKKAYESAFVDYQALGTTADNASIEKALSKAYTAVQSASKAVKSANAFIQLYEDTLETHNRIPAAAAGAALDELSTFTGQLNSHFSSLLSDTNSLKQDKQNIVEKQQSLAETMAGTDSLDLRSSKLSVTKAQNSLEDAKTTLADYYVRAPFAGTIAAVDAKKYETASGVLATLITTQKIAELSLNEVDAAKVKLGNKATLTFDALEDLTLTGEVVEIDTIGAVEQGVVSYSLKIAFDSQDERIKSGMTVNSSIQTAVKQDVLTVPTSAVKTQNGVSYVQVFDPALGDTGGTQGVISKIPPQQVMVEVGISDDTTVEILSGLTEGQQIVTRTASGAATTQSTTQGAPSLLGGGAVRTSTGGGGFAPR